jgi:predicted transcriptional regulator
MAAELAYLEFGDLIDSMVEEGKFTSDESRTLARLGLANYFAAAAYCPTASSTTSPRTSATTSSGCRRSTR